MLLTAVWVLAAVYVTILVLRGFDARRMPPLEPWHRPQPVGEVGAEQLPPGTAIGDYLGLEERIFARLESEIYVENDSPGTRFNRYRRGSDADPARAGRNWNRTWLAGPDNAPAGGALVLHGLTDSPYSVRAVGEICARHGYRVVGLRVPGHGTVPGALTRVHRDDWRAAVEMAAVDLASGLPEGAPFVICGYSTGGALALSYTLDALERRRLRLPDRLFLFSPAVGVSIAAVFANWHKAISWIPYFRQLEWASIEPEYDPFKYNSFPKNAGDQVHLLTKSLKRRLAGRVRRQRLGEMPPIHSFQSIVDTTIVVDDLVDKLHGVVPPNGSELVLFDINRWSSLSGFLKGSHDKLLRRLEATPALPYDLTLVTNASPESREVVARTRTATSPRWDREQALGLSWPDQVYSLSHVAVSFPPDDPYYGAVAADPAIEDFHLGTLHPRGERGQLRVPVEQLMRLRYNPFFPLIEERMTRALARPEARASGEGGGPSNGQAARSAGPRREPAGPELSP